jgi:hypothetical protein
MGVMLAVEKVLLKEAELLKEASGFLAGVDVLTGMATILTAPDPESPLLLKRSWAQASFVTSSSELLASNSCWAALMGGATACESCASYSPEVAVAAADANRGNLGAVRLMPTPDCSWLLAKQDPGSTVTME